MGGVYKGVEWTVQDNVCVRRKYTHWEGVKTPTDHYKKKTSSCLKGDKFSISMADYHYKEDKFLFKRRQVLYIYGRLPL